MCFLNENKTEVFLLRVLIEVGRRATSKRKQRVRTLYTFIYVFLCSMKMHFIMITPFDPDPLSKFIKIFRLLTNQQPQRMYTVWNWSCQFISEQKRISVSSKYRTDTFLISKTSVICRCCFFVQLFFPLSFTTLVAFGDHLMYNVITHENEWFSFFNHTNNNAKNTKIRRYFRERVKHFEKKFHVSSFIHFCRE